jgi:hypothetical protein
LKPSDQKVPGAVNDGENSIVIIAAPAAAGLDAQRSVAFGCHLMKMSARQASFYDGRLACRIELIGIDAEINGEVHI